MDHGYFRSLEDANVHVDRFRREADAFRINREARRRGRAARRGAASPDR